MATPGSETAISRRALLASSLGGSVALATACTPGESSQSTLPSASASGSPAPSTDADADPFLASVISAVAAQRGFVVAVQQAFPRLGVRYLSLVELHDAHLRFLNGLPGASQPTSLPDIPDIPDIPASRLLSDRAVATGTAQLAALLAAQSIEAQDGSLARALASLSAGVAQRASAIGWAPADLSPELPAAAALTGPEINALQLALAHAHAGLWSYGVLGGQTSATKSPALFAGINAGYAANRDARDQLSALLMTVGAVPVAALPTYPPLSPLDVPRQIASAAQTLERASAATNSWLVAQTRDDVRAWAAAALTNAAIRELVVQGTPENFPGADEFADR